MLDGALVLTGHPPKGPSPSVADTKGAGKPNWSAGATRSGPGAPSGAPGPWPPAYPTTYVAAPPGNPVDMGARRADKPSTM
jgi:hypothetical protein